MISSTDDNIRLLIHYMARDGLDENEIAQRLNLKISYIKKLIKNDEDIIRDMEYAKLLTDYRVEDALLKKAVGTTIKEVKETDKGSGVETVTHTKDVLGDTSAIAFWLKNRCPERWSDKSAENGDTIERLDRIFKSIDDTAEKKSKELKRNSSTGK